MVYKGKLFVLNNETVYRFAFSTQHCTVFNEKMDPGVYLIIDDHFDVFCSVLVGYEVCMVRYDAIKNLILESEA